MTIKDEELKTGDRVIVRSNEDCTLLIGTIIDFENFGNPRNEFFPVVIEEETGKLFVCLGIVKPYSDELIKELEPLTPKEQWNKLSKNYKRG